MPQKVEKTENPAKASNDFAVIKTGGKQYLVTPGLKFNVEKIEGKEGDKVNFSEVLLKEVAGKLEIGEPLVKDSKVEGKIIEQTKGDKIVVLKYKKRKNYRRKQGHRQKLTRVEIVKI
ncbi:MAG: 50S ribosomal protein L21 [Patescibacteria group bacterium]|nr:50S ribosomal protein L21 [Patescibacteria group bacterium]MCL5094212.1 50S ribosomal protein L21 [Patescibacteria group bacterium]